MDYSILKALHIIFVVTWFAGLFYIVRLFIYHTEAQEKPEAQRIVLQEQFKIMEKRLWYGITWPSMIFTLILGPSLIQFFLPLNENPWLLTKLLFVFGLILYHFYCHYIFKKLQKDIIQLTSNQLRVWNEVATLFLVAIVFLVVLKSLIGMVWGILGLLAFSGLLMAGIHTYRRVRN